MLISLNRKSLLTIYLSVLRPGIIMASPNTQISCSKSCSDAIEQITPQTQTQSTSIDKGVSGSIHAGKYCRTTSCLNKRNKY